jgi:hypothetical protein
VHVRHDPHDAARIVVYSAERDKFLCIAEDPDLTGNSRMQIAIAAQKAQRTAISAVRAEVRNIHRLYPPEGAADRILIAAGDGFALDAESVRAMEAADRPRLIAHARALEEIDNADAAPAPIEPTADQVEGAREAAEELASASAAPAPAMIRCDGYERPLFDRDLDLWRWADAHTASGRALDAEDAKLIAELRHDTTFQQLLSIDTKRIAGGGAA